MCAKLLQFIVLMYNEFVKILLDYINTLYTCVCTYKYDRSRTNSLNTISFPFSVFSVFLRRDCMEDTMFVKLRGGAGKLSVSHDSVFPGEVPHTRPLSSLANLATLEVSIFILLFTGYRIQ